MITGPMSLTEATSDHISFFEAKVITKELQDTKAGCVLIPNDLIPPKNFQVLFVPVEEPKLHFIKLIHRFFYPQQNHSFVHPSAYIEKEGVFIGENTWIEAQSFIDKNVTIGKRCRIGSHVSIHAGTQIGDDVFINSHSVLGNEGFGFFKNGSENLRFPQVGRLVIENKVYVGSNCSINKGTLNETRIGKNVVLDDHVHIAHNVRVGAGTIIAGMSGIAGSVSLGENCILAGNTGVREQVRICDQVVILGYSAVSKDILKPGVYSGIPAISHRKNLRRQARLNRMVDEKSSF